MSRSYFPGRTRPRPVMALALASALTCVAAPHAAFAGLPPEGSTNAPSDPQVARFVHDAEAAMRAGHLELAILQLKNAVILQPHNAVVRGQLGLARLSHRLAQQSPHAQIAGKKQQFIAVGHRLERWRARITIAVSSRSRKRTSSGVRMPAQVASGGSRPATRISVAPVARSTSRR